MRAIHGPWDLQIYLSSFMFNWHYKLSLIFQGNLNHVERKM